MKKIFAIAIAVLTLNACNSPKDQEKALLKEIIGVHDEVMTREEKLMQHKMQLDTLLLKTRDTTEKAIITAVNTRLVKADAAMESWMQNFDPSMDGKSHEQKVAYLTAQKKAVLAVDSQLQAAVKASEVYLSKTKK